MPLSYLGLEIGNIIHVPLINNEKAFGVDYSKENVLNGQLVYPLWVVTEMDIKLDKVIIKAYQLHKLDSDVTSNLIFPPETIAPSVEPPIQPEEEPEEEIEEETEIVKEDLYVNLNEFHSDYTVNGEPLKNWNYYTGPFDNENYNYIHDDDLQIPYGDKNEDGILNVVDIVGMVDSVLNNEYSKKLDLTEDEILNVLDIIAIVDIVIND